MFTELLLFVLCSDAVAHRQFDGEYPLLLFFLSSVIPFGECPISDRKLKNEFFHLLHTFIPLPP